jgi:hypothetical protein
VQSSHDVGTAFPDAAPADYVWITVTTESLTLAKSRVLLGKELEIQVDLDKLPPRTGPYAITCNAAIGESSAAFATASSELYWLPPSPYGGSIVQLDSSSGKLLVSGKGTDGMPGAGGASFFPIGYYTSWGNYLESNFSILSEIKAVGYTLVHPIPGGGSVEEAWGENGLQRFAQFLDAALEAGVWVMYDMRHTFSSIPDLGLQIKAFRSHPALLLWYTADVSLPDPTTDGS